jgi:hypothetical protein
MKNLILGIFAGLVSIAVFLGIALFSFYPTAHNSATVPTELLPKSGTAAKDATPPPKNENTTVPVTGVIDLPDSLKAKFHPGMTMIAQLHPRGQRLGKNEVVSIPPMKVDRFPYQFKIDVPTLTMSGWLGKEPQPPLMLTFQYCYAPNSECKGDVPALVARSMIKVDLMPVGDQKIDAGRILFSSNMRYNALNIAAPLPECKRDKPISGKIVPTQEFLGNVRPGAKYAYFFLREPTSLTAAEMDKDISGDVLASDFFTPQAQGTSFTIPMSKFSKPSYYVGYVAECNATDSLAACSKNLAMSHFFPTNENQTAFALFPKDLTTPYCADSNPSEFFLHRISKAAMPAAGRQASQKNPKVPPEVIEGQFL